MSVLDDHCDGGNCAEMKDRNVDKDPQDTHPEYDHQGGPLIVTLPSDEDEKARLELLQKWHILQ